MTEWKDSHDQYLDEWVSFPYEIKRYQEWLPVFTPFPDTGDILAQEMFDAIEGKLENLEEYLARIIYYLGELEKKLNAIEYYMTKAAEQLEAYLDSTKVLEIEQIHGVDASLVIGSDYNDLNNINTANLTDWSIVGEGGLNFTDFNNDYYYEKCVCGDNNFIYVGSNKKIITFSVDGSGNLTFVSSVNTSYYIFSICKVGNFIYTANDAYGLNSFSVDEFGSLTYLNSYGGYTRYVWADENYVYSPAAVYGGIGLRIFLVNGSGSFTLIDSHHIAGTTPYKGVWGADNFIYTICGVNLLSYSVDGSGHLTFIDSIDINAQYTPNIWANSNFIFVADSNGIDSVSNDGTSLTLIDSISGNCRSIFGFNNILYTGNNYGISIYSFDVSGNLTFIDEDPGRNVFGYGDGIWSDGNFVYLAHNSGGVYVYSYGSIQILYEYEGAGWDNDSIITKYISDWDFGKDYLIHPLITFDGDYGIYPNIDIFTKAKTTIEGTKYKITDSEDVLEDYI